MSLPYFNFYISDFLAGTSHLNHTEKGVFIHLLCLCWDTPKGTIPKDEEWIFSRLRPNGKKEKDAIRKILKEKFKINRGRYFNERLLKERRKSKEKYDNKRRANRNRSKKSSVMANNTPAVKQLNSRNKSPRTRKEPELKLQPKLNEDKSSSCSNDDAEFDKFWSVYPGTQGQSRSMAYKAWLDLTDDAQSRAIQSLTGYNHYLKTKAQNSQAWFPVTYLRDKIFETFPNSTKSMQVVKKGSDAWEAWKEYKSINGATYFPDSMTVPSILPPNSET